MKKLLLLLMIALTGLAPVLMVQAAEPTALDSTEPAHVRSVAERLCRNYFAERYRMMGAECVCDVELDAPEAIQGWSGRWRMHGFATVRNYRSDGNWTAREEAIRGDTQRSAKEKRRQIARERLIKSERIEFEAILSNLDSKPEIDVTLR